MFKRLVYLYGLTAKTAMETGGVIGGLLAIALMAPVYLPIRHLFPDINLLVPFFIAVFTCVMTSRIAGSSQLHQPRNPSHSTSFAR